MPSLAGPVSNHILIKLPEEELTLLQPCLQYVTFERGSVRGVELAGGAWATRGYASGGLPGGWTSVGFSVGGGRFLIVALDYSSPTWTASPGLRAMLAIRQGLTLSMPFVRGRSIGERKGSSPTFGALRLPSFFKWPWGGS